MLDAGEIGAKMNALDLWEVLMPFNWAVKPRGTAFPYFCSVLKGEKEPVRYRFLMIEGWQTLHDYIRTRIDRNYGFYSTPSEMPHFELVALTSGETRLFRHDPGYVPQELKPSPQRDLAAKILWEAYGVMLRLETDRKLPLKYADEKSVFARVEGKDGVWSDEPLSIPDPPALVEKVAFAKDDLKAAKDLPLHAGSALSLDFRLVPRLMTQETRPRCVYELKAVDAVTGALAFESRASADRDGGLKALWESMPAQVLKLLLKRGALPGEIKVCSGRVFRMLRPLCIDLPFKLSLHDELPVLG